MGKTFSHTLHCTEKSISDRSYVQICVKNIALRGKSMRAFFSS